MDTLQYRRDVAGLATLNKVQEERVSHLRQLLLPPCQAEMHTSAVMAAPSTLATQLHTSHQQQQFQEPYDRRSNEFLASEKCPNNLSVAGFEAQKLRNFLRVGKV